MTSFISNSTIRTLFPTNPNNLNRIFQIVFDNDGAIGGSLPLSQFISGIHPKDIDIYFRSEENLKNAAQIISNEFNVVVFKSGSYGRNSVLSIDVGTVGIELVLVQHFDDPMDLVKNGHNDLTVIYWRGEYHYSDDFMKAISVGHSLKGVHVMNGGTAKLASRGLLPSYVKLPDVQTGFSPPRRPISNLKNHKMNCIEFRTVEWHDWEKLNIWQVWEDNIQHTKCGVKGVYSSSYPYSISRGFKVYTSRSIVNGELKLTKQHVPLDCHMCFDKHLN